MNYASLKSIITTKREFNMWVKRLKKIKDPKQQKIQTNKNGVEMLKWEKDFLQSLNRRANANRKKIQQSIKEERAIGFLPTDEELRYRPAKVNPDNYQSRATFDRVLAGEWKYSQGTIIEEKNQILRQNLIQSLDKWPDNNPWVEAMTQLFQTADPRDLRIIQSDPHYNVELSANYITLYTHDQEDLLAEGEALYYRWLNAVQAVAENRAVLGGTK